MSNRKQIAQVAQDKWATISDLLRSLMINEQMSDLLKKCWLKKSKILFFSMFYIQFFYWKNERIAHFLFFGERCEWIAQVAHQKWAMWANRSGCSPKMSDPERFAQVAQSKWAIVRESLRSLTKNEWMSELLVFLSKLLICSFLGKKQAICLKNRWKKQPKWRFKSWIKAETRRKIFFGGFFCLKTKNTLLRGSKIVVF